MKLLLVALSCLVAVVVGGPVIVEEPMRFYHESEGIRRAEEIRQAELAIDFDGARIVGGNAASLGQFPYMGGLVITLTNGATSVCGSSLVRNNRLVTAAHCWWDGSNQARQFTVVLGSLTLFSGGTRVTTSDVTMHNSWNPSIITNDVAIIRLSSAVSLGGNINVIALASGSNLYVGERASAAGFGRQSDSSGITTSQRLHHVTLSVIANNVCQQVFGSVSVIASTICTSGIGGTSTCGGDSGGPLVLNNQLIGITSFGSALGCQRGFPAAFARVTAFNSWFNSNF